MAGLELDVLPVATFNRLKRNLGFDRYADLSPLIKELRMIKSAFELTQIRKSGQILSKIFREAKNVIREGVREIDIEAALVAASTESAVVSAELPPASEPADDTTGEGEPA